LSSALGAASDRMPERKRCCSCERVPGARCRRCHRDQSVHTSPPACWCSAAAPCSARPPQVARPPDRRCRHRCRSSRSTISIRDRAASKVQAGIEGLRCQRARAEAGITDAAGSSAGSRLQCRVCRQHVLMASAASGAPRCPMPAQNAEPSALVDAIVPLLNRISREKWIFCGCKRAHEALSKPAQTDGPPHGVSSTQARRSEVAAQIAQPGSDPRRDRRRGDYGTAARAARSEPGTPPHASLAKTASAMLPLALGARRRRCSSQPCAGNGSSRLHAVTTLPAAGTFRPQGANFLSRLGLAGTPREACVGPHEAERNAWRWDTLRVPADAGTLPVG
jgi:hypothetical protein